MKKKQTKICKRQKTENNQTTKEENLYKIVYVKIIIYFPCNRNFNVFTAAVLCPSSGQVLGVF